METRLAALIFALAIAFIAAPLQADDHSCCAKSASAKKSMCADYAKLNLSPEQTRKLTALQEKCEKAGCTKESRAQFLRSAQRVLSAEQYAQLRTECAKTEEKS